MEGSSKYELVGPPGPLSSPSTEVIHERLQKCGHVAVAVPARNSEVRDRRTKPIGLRFKDEHGFITVEELAVGEPNGEFRVS